MYVSPRRRRRQRLHFNSCELYDHHHDNYAQSWPYQANDLLFAQRFTHIHNKRHTPPTPGLCHIGTHTWPLSHWHPHLAFVTLAPSHSAQGRGTMPVDPRVHPGLLPQMLTCARLTVVSGGGERAIPKLSLSARGDCGFFSLVEKWSSH